MYGVDFLLYLIFTGISLSLLPISCWFVLVLDDLTHDLQNPLQGCQTMNRLFIPEYNLNSAILLISALSFRYVVFLANLPCFIFNIVKYLRRSPTSYTELYDSTTILSRNVLRRNTQEHWVKIVYYLISFIAYAMGALIYFILYISTHEDTTSVEV